MKSSPSDLAVVRRIEAVSFRSFPSTSTHYDGTWAIRLTAGHPAKRLNSVTPLDPHDDGDMERRLELARQRFDGFGRPLVFRLSPLAPSGLMDLLDARGWVAFEASLVMAAPLDPQMLSRAVDHVPLRDVGRWVESWHRLAGEPRDRKPGLVEVLSAIRAENGLFLHESLHGEPGTSQPVDSEPICAVRCTRDGDLAGIFELETACAHRRQGHGRALLLSALKWAQGRGAVSAWLQVRADNAEAIGLYRSLGFMELYRYEYRRPPNG